MWLKPIEVNNIYINIKYFNYNNNLNTLLIILSMALFKLIPINYNL